MFCANCALAVITVRPERMGGCDQGTSTYLIPYNPFWTAVRLRHKQTTNEVTMPHLPQQRSHAPERQLLLKPSTVSPSCMGALSGQGVEALPIVPAAQDHLFRDVAPL